MGLHLPRLFTLFTACSIVLAATPLVVAAPHDLRDGSCHIAAHHDAAAVPASCGESVEEERTGEPDAADGDIDLHAGPPVVIDRSRRCSGRITAAHNQTAAGPRGIARSIRGPPAG